MTEPDIAAIIEALKVKPVPALEHKQYIDGRLWLTEEQYDSIKNEFRYRPPASPEQSISSIPVEIAYDGRPNHLSDGRTLIYSKTIGSFLIFKQPPGFLEFDRVFHV